MKYAILTLEKEKAVLETALKSWSDYSKKEYSVAYNGHLNELNDLEKAIKMLKNGE